MTYVTPNRLNRSLALPITLPQTELRRARSIRLGHFKLMTGQSLELRALNLHLLKILTPGVVPDYINKPLGFVSVGVYFGTMLCSSIALVRARNIGCVQFNPYQSRVLRTPGIYTVMVSNNTNNVDASVCVTGSMKLYL